MTFFQDMTQAMETYPADHVELEIIEMDFPGPALNQDEEGSFKVQLKNNGPLHLTDITVKVKGVNGALVAGAGAADFDFRSELVHNTMDRLNAHGDPQVFAGTLKFKAPDSSQSRMDLIEITIEDWNANLDHIMNSHSEPVDEPKAKFTRRVLPG